MKNTIEAWLGTLFGLIFVGQSLLVAFETVLRKTLNMSLQGVDELGGYALAVGGTIAFSLALMGRSHIRVDVLHEHLPRALRTLLNWLSAVALAALAVLMAWLAWFVIEDTRTYMSVAQTPWATPLQYPQSAWLLGLGLFAAVTLWGAVRATWLLLRGDAEGLDRQFGPRSTKEDVAEELEDLRHRSADIDLPTRFNAEEKRA